MINGWETRGKLGKISRYCFTTAFVTLSRDICALYYIGWAATRRCTYPSSNYRGSSGWWTVHPADVISRNLSRGRTLSRGERKRKRKRERALERPSSSSRSTAEMRTKNARIARRSNSTAAFYKGFLRFTRRLLRDRAAVCIPTITAITSLRCWRCSARWKSRDHRSRRTSNIAMRDAASI